MLVSNSNSIISISKLVWASDAINNLLHRIQNTLVIHYFRMLNTWKRLRFEVLLLFLLPLQTHLGAKEVDCPISISFGYLGIFIESITVVECLRSWNPSTVEAIDGNLWRGIVRVDVSYSRRVHGETDGISDVCEQFFVVIRGVVACGSIDDGFISPYRWIGKYIKHSRECTGDVPELFLFF